MMAAPCESDDDEDTDEAEEAPTERDDAASAVRIRAAASASARKRPRRTSSCAPRQRLDLLLAQEEPPSLVAAPLLALVRCWRCVSRAASPSQELKSTLNSFESG